MDPRFHGGDEMGLRERLTESFKSGFEAVLSGVGQVFLLADFLENISVM